MEPDVIKKQINEALEEYFNRGVEQKKFLDVSRIPLICQDISNIHTAVQDIKEKLDQNFVTKESFWPIKTLVYGATGIILVAVFSALVYLVVQK